MSDHVSDLAIDRMLASEVIDADVRAHLASCERCTGRLAELERERAAFAIPLAKPAASRRSAWLAAAGALAAAAIVLVVVRRSDDPSGTRTKGSTSPVLELHVVDQRSGGATSVPVTAATVLHPGDTIQATYASASPGHGAVLSLDGAGAATVYVPVAPLAAGSGSFPAATILDDVLGTERLAIVWCPAPFAVEPLLVALKARTLVAPPGCTIAQLEVAKR